jgi:hypothetical protein
MKKQKSILGKILSIVLMVSGIGMVSSCDLFRGEQGEPGVSGPEGNEGPQGPIGEQGLPGNANVTLYTFGQVDFRTLTERQIIIPLLAGEMPDGVLLMPFLANSDGDSYSIPGPGTSDRTEYRSFKRNATTSGIPLRIVKGEGPGELYTGIRVFKIVANATVNGRIQLPDVDWQDYNAIIDYFGFEDE